MNPISSEDQQTLDCLRSAVAEALDRKRRLGQYAVIWRDGQPVILGNESPSKSGRVPHPDIAGKDKTLGDLVEPIIGD